MFGKKSKSKIEIKRLDEIAAQSIKKIDLYNDGHFSLAVAFKTGYGSSGVYLFENIGGELSKQGKQICDRPTLGLEVMDVNGDGYQDIVAAFETGYGSSGIYFIINNGNGTFTIEDVKKPKGGKK